MARSMFLGAEYCFTFTVWLALMVPHPEQPCSIFPSVSGLLSKGEQGAEKDGLCPGFIPESSWGTVEAQYGVQLY